MSYSEGHTLLEKVFFFVVFFKGWDKNLNRTKQRNKTIFRNINKCTRHYTRGEIKFTCNLSDKFKIEKLKISKKENKMKKDTMLKLL